MPPTTPQGECLDRLPIILITPPPIEQSKSDELGLTNKTNRQYADIVHLVAQECNGLVLDLFEILDQDNDYWTDGVHLTAKGNELVYQGLMELIKEHHPQLAPMVGGNGKYGEIGMPLDEKLWYERC